MVRDVQKHRTERFRCGMNGDQSQPELLVDVVDAIPSLPGDHIRPPIASAVSEGFSPDANACLTRPL